MKTTRLRMNSIQKYRCKITQSKKMGTKKRNKMMNMENMKNFNKDNSQFSLKNKDN